MGSSKMVNKDKSVCHVCLVDGEGSFFDNNSTKHLELIKECIGIDMIQHESLSSVICCTCSSELKIVVNFVSKCRTSCEKLEKMFVENIPLKEDIKEEDDVALSLLCNSKIKIENIDDDFQHYDDGIILYSLDKPKVRKYKRRKPKVRVKEKCVLTCETCGIETPSKSALIVHNRTHTGEKPYVCKECHKCFSQSSTLKEHIGRVHDRDKQLTVKSCVCDYCGKICYRKNELRVHLRVHTKEKPYQCDICQESFTQQGSLAAHLRRHKGEKPFSCHVCASCFSSTSALRSHMMVHSSEKKFKCHICDKSVKTSKALKNHLLVHADVKSNICDKCGARFSQKGNLKQHLVARHSERSGDCVICKKFYSDLVTHMRTHNGEKPFKCTDCDKAFAKSAHLTIHLKRHRESSKFPCTFHKCEATFPLQSQLDYHTMKIHTKEFAFTCHGVGCKKGFYRLTDLNRHKNLNPSCKTSTLNTEDSDHS